MFGKNVWEKFLVFALWKSHCGNYRIFLLRFFWQKFRETNSFTKELIWRNIFSERWISVSFFHTINDNTNGAATILSQKSREINVFTKWLNSKLIWRNKFAWQRFRVWHLVLQIAWNFQIHFSLELVGGFDQTQFPMKA